MELFNDNQTLRSFVWKKVCKSFFPFFCPPPPFPGREWKWERKNKYEKTCSFLPVLHGQVFPNYQAGGSWTYSINWGSSFHFTKRKTSDPIKQGNFLCLCFQKHRALEKIRNKKIRRQAAFFLFNFQCAKNDLYMQETGKILFPVIRPRITLVNSTMRHAGGKKIFLLSSSRETVLCSQNWLWLFDLNPSSFRF